MSESRIAGKATREGARDRRDRMQLARVDLSEKSRKAQNRGVAVTELKLLVTSLRLAGHVCALVVDENTPDDNATTEELYAAIATMRRLSRENMARIAHRSSLIAALKLATDKLTEKGELMCFLVDVTAESCAPLSVKALKELTIDRNSQYENEWGIRDTTSDPDEESDPADWSECQTASATLGMVCVQTNDSDAIDELCEAAKKTTLAQHHEGNETPIGISLGFGNMTI
jgi:hypothetical protein